MRPADPFARGAGELPLAFGVSGPLGTPLVGESAVTGRVGQAFSAGIRWFDTAPAYGAGLAERRLGRALSGLKGAKVSTKVGVSASGLAKRMRDFSPDGVERSLDASLGRLDRSAVDLLWLHGPSPLELTEELLMRLDRIMADGRIHALGAATRSEGLAGLLERFGFDAIMLPCHAGLDAEGKAAIAQAQAVGAVMFGIEALTPARLSTSPLSGRGGLWRSLKRLRGGSIATGEPLTVEASLHWALRAVGPGFVSTTTTKPAHLAETVQITQAWLASMPERG